MPDEIEKQIRNCDFLDLEDYQVKSTEKEILSFSLDLLIDAIQFTNRAYIFDNSTHEHIWLAEITDGHLMEMKTDQVPAWFNKALGDKFNIGGKTNLTV